MPTFIKINDQLSFGDMSSHKEPDGKTAMVHACKEPCHRHTVGYSGKIGKDHPHYLSLEKDHHLYLNLIDPPAPLFQKESFTIFFDFIDRALAETKPIHIHCNQGQSRAPSLAIIIMAKRLNLLPDNSYETARAAFEKRHPYTPGKGIEIFLGKNWKLLG